MTRWASSAIAGLLAAIVIYSALRVGQALFGVEADPAAVIYSEHSGYLWRVAIALYAGGLLALATSLLVRPPLRILTWGLPVAAAALVAQALFVP
jgi:hypothetical protein